MKKIFTLFATALLTMGASAQTTVFSATPLQDLTENWSTPTGETEITATYATISGGKMFTINEQDVVKEMIKKQGGEYAFQCTNNNTYFKVVLSEALQAGDVISARLQSRTDTDLGLFFAATSTRPSETTTAIILPTAAEQAWGDAPTYTVATGDGICGETTFYIYRATGKSTYFNTFAITRGGGGGGETGLAEIWRADDLIFENDIVQPKADGSVTYEVTEISNSNFFSVPQDKKIYPEGTYAAGGVDVLPADGTPITMKSYELTIKTNHMTLHAVSTPNTDASENEGWQLGGGGTNGLNTAECAVTFEKYIKPKNGNPSIAYKEYYEETKSGTSFRVSETLWEPELGVMPAKGLYYEFTPSANGDLLLALCIWRPKNHVYVFEKSTMTQFPVSALSVDGYANQNTVIWGTNTTAYTTMTMNDTHDYLVDGIPDKPMFGYMTLKNLEANKTYVLLSKDGQPGIYGFQFTPGGDPSGVEVITSKTNNTWNANAPMYNLSGQKVDKSYKGIVIQNGRKFVNK